MRLFRFTHRLSILTLIALGLNGCSSKTQLELFERGILPVKDKDELFVSRLWSMSKRHGCCVMSRWYPHNDSLDIVKDHIDVIVNLNVWNEQKTDYLLQLHGAKFEKVALDKKYRSQKSKLFDVLSPKASEFNEDGIHFLSKILGVRSEGIRKDVGSILNLSQKDKVSDILTSIIHMSMNRIFIANPRHQELVIYYFTTERLNLKTPSISSYNANSQN